MEEFNHKQRRGRQRKANNSREEKFKESSKKRLSNNIRKKFDTTIIGSLAVMEEFFGELWGHGLRYNELTDDEKDWREAWEEARTKMLDLGNSNSRASQNEISQYTISWNKYVTNFIVLKDDKE
jgi:hypothetical protein